MYIIPPINIGSIMFINIKLLLFFISTVSGAVPLALRRFVFQSRVEMLVPVK